MAALCRQRWHSEKQRATLIYPNPLTPYTHRRISKVHSHKNPTKYVNAQMPILQERNKECVAVHTN